MKSKSFDLKKSPAEKGKGNKTFDFVGFYTSAAETNVKLLQKPKTVENLDKENSFNLSTATGKRERSPNKKKKKNKQELVEISQINIDGRSLNVSGRSSPVNGSRATSTPNVNRNAHSAGAIVKSIMKNPAVAVDDTMDATVETPTSKSKKRNKSVSFMLDDTEETVIKKTKSNDSLKGSKESEKTKKASKAEEKKAKKLKKHLKAEKENKANIRMETDQNTEVPNKKIISKTEKQKITQEATGDSASDGQSVQEKKKKLRKIKKPKKVEESSEPTENDSNNNEETEQKSKKLKKKKRIAKATTEDAEEEPATKLKKEVKPDVIVEDLENLSIGDNAHTLTNLLDEMMVVDKDKKKKNKLRRKKDKATNPGSVSSSETADLEKIEEGKEKTKWKKRKWNKDKKGDLQEVIATSVIIENLPLKIMCSYKKSLAEHFGPCGLIKRIGIAEMYPTEEPKPVFTTTINFYSEGAATKALEEDNTSFEGSRIRVKRPLPPTDTTIVVRSYAELTEQNLSSVFTGAGRIRNIRHLVKGKKSMCTAFIEFDGPEAVEKALKMAEDAKIGAKKIHVSKFEQRGSKHKGRKVKGNQDSENEGDSEDSND